MSEAQLKKHTTEGFGEVNTQLSSLADGNLQRVLKAKILQKAREIRTHKQVWIVHFLLHAIETNSHDVNSSL